jgi:hypothetical protein
VSDSEINNLKCGVRMAEEERTRKKERRKRKAHLAHCDHHSTSVVFDLWGLLLPPGPSEPFRTSVAWYYVHWCTAMALMALSLSLRCEW